jgi:hypothetical protein
MSETLLPIIEEEWKKPPADVAERTSLLTRVEVIEGDVLTYLERQGATPLRRLTRELEWPPTMILMAVGALTQEGLVRAVQHDLELVIEPGGRMGSG